MSVKCLQCQDGARLPNGWQCNVCGRVAHSSLPAPGSAACPNVVCAATRDGVRRVERCNTRKELADAAKFARANAFAECLREVGEHLIMYWTDDLL